MEAIATSGRRVDVLVGPAGTGKTFLAIAKAVEALEEGKISRIILSRPAVEAIAKEVAVMDRIIADGGTFAGEVVNLRKDGTPVSVFESITPILDSQKRPQYYLAILTDLTERKLTEQKLLHVQKLEGLGVMAAGIAHDFNNLLAGMLGYAGLAQDTLGPGHPARPMLDQVIKAAQKATVLTNQMLAYAGKGRFHMEVLVLDRLVEDLVPLLRPSLSKKIEIVRRFVIGSDPESTLMIVMASVALAANATCLWLVSRHRHDGAHMKASTIFSTNDVIANLGVVAAGILVALTGSPYPDLVIGAAIVVVVLLGARRILRLR